MREKKHELGERACWGGGRSLLPQGGQGGPSAKGMLEGRE